MQWMDRRGVKYILITFIFSLTVYLLIPTVMTRSEFSTHFVISHYICLLRKTILLLPIVMFLYNILPLRKLLDYEKYLPKIPEKYFILIIFVLALLATNLISYYLYDHIPQGDAIPPFYQTKIFAEGKRWANPPIYPDFFMAEMVIHNDKWFSITPPGHSIILLPGTILKIPWIICPLLGSLSLIIFYLLLKLLFNPRIARTGAVFLLLSPTFLFISADMLAQNSSYFFLLTALLLTARGIKAQKPIYQLLSGLSVGFAFFSRPQLSVVFAVALIIFSFKKCSGRPTCLPQNNRQTHRFAPTIFFVVGIVPFLIAQLADNYTLTGSPFHYGYHIYEAKKYHDMGFGLGIGAPTFNIPGHTPMKAIINLLYNGFVFSLHLFGWPLISLIFVPLAVFKKIKTAWDRLAIGIVIGAIIFWIFYWFHGISPMGPKYYYEIVPLLVLLTVRGIDELRINLRPLITLLFFITIFVYIPQASKVFSIWGANLNCFNEVNKKNLQNAIVFVKDLPEQTELQIDKKEPQIINTINRFNYPSVSIRNSPNLDESDIIYARDLGDQDNKRLKELYPDRKTYLFEYLIEAKLESRFIGTPKTWHLIEYKL